MTRPVVLACAFTMGVLCAVTPVSAEEVVPLPRAHSHNDYHRKAPLHEALENGVCSVEADVFRVKDDLLVAHDFDKVDPEKTLTSMYLAPLAKIARENGGYIYEEGLPFILLIDFKSAGDVTWPVLKEKLDPYKDILTEFTLDSTTTRAVTVIVSGSRPIETMAAEPVRYAGVDGRVNELGEQSNPHVFPMISASWFSHFKWIGTGEMPANQHARLKETVKQVHENGQILRFWAIPARVEFWDFLYDEGVDLINADHLGKVREFLLEKRGITVDEAG